MLGQEAVKHFGQWLKMLWLTRKTNQEKNLNECWGWVRFRLIIWCSRVEETHLYCLFWTMYISTIYSINLNVSTFFFSCNSVVIWFLRSVILKEFCDAQSSDDKNKSFLASGVLQEFWSYLISVVVTVKKEVYTMYLR